jgi:hypothetical protein
MLIPIPYFVLLAAAHKCNWPAGRPAAAAAQSSGTKKLFCV